MWDARFCHAVSWAQQLAGTSLCLSRVSYLRVFVDQENIGPNRAKSKLTDRKQGIARQREEKGKRKKDKGKAVPSVFVAFAFFLLPFYFFLCLSRDFGELKLFVYPHAC
jgi:hypothetical protein